MIKTRNEKKIFFESLSFLKRRIHYKKKYEEFSSKAVFRIEKTFQFPAENLLF